jgi:hypothetical protein
MYIILQKQGRGSWQVASSRLYDDVEKVEGAIRRLQSATAPNLNEYRYKYIGDSDEWKTI